MRIRLARARSCSVRVVSPGPRDWARQAVNGTGAQGASACIVMARDEEHGGNATMFLIPMNSSGLKIEREIDTLDEGFAGGHSVLTFDKVRAEFSDILGEAGQGFRYAQIRLAPARLTHCMRWLGQARRAHDVALAYARTINIDLSGIEYVEAFMEVAPARVADDRLGRLRRVDAPEARELLLSDLLQVVRAR